ncbi:MAG: glycosyltransferase family 4 protein [Marinobacter adhaerens]|uniref:Glycosyltransferase family 4 protein n=1 Tax=Marinobacter adhaerens TaxID=1033846 RepID=A0A844I3F3_9GAMM|nr:glycosyltransferase family 4 protein [Marinobacter adhaerens]
MKEYEARKQRVLLVVRWPVGGIRTFLKYVLARFPPDKYEFVFLGANTEAIGALRQDLGAIVSEWLLFPEDGNELKSCFNLVKKTLKSQKFDLIHAHGFTSAVSCVFPARLKQVPVICTSHDVLLPTQFSGWKGRLKKIGLFAALSQCRIVQSVSVDAEANLSAALPWLQKRRMRVILNGVDTKAFESSVARDLKTEFSLPKDTMLIGFFGRFMGQKGFGILVDAIKKLNEREMIAPNIHVVCFGSGAFIREEQANIEALNLSGAFTFIPFTADISGAMKGCDIVAMPSRWEACGLVAMEALAAGVPFVGSNCIGLREVLDGTPAIVVETGDSESLARGIIECLNKGAKPFTDYAPEAVDRFDVRRTSEQIQAMYEQVLK